MYGMIAPAAANLTPMSPGALAHGFCTSKTKPPIGSESSADVGLQEKASEFDDINATVEIDDGKHS